MSTVDATAGDAGRPATVTEEAPAAPAAVVGPLAGDPAMLGLSSFIVGSIALGLGLVGVVPVGVLGLDHGWFAITVTAVLATVKLLLVSWLVVILMLTLATLRLPAAFTAVFGLICVALLLLLLAFAEASPLGVPSSGLLKTAGYVVLVFAAIGVYLFFDAAAAGTGGKSLPLGKPLMH